jgi:hypothetical protein
MALLASLVFAWPAHAQVGLSGTITDATDAVLPGVTVTALHTATGNTFVAVTDAEGRYRLPTLRPGVYRVTAELTGFTPVTQDGLELLVGQQGTRNFKLTLSGVQESITVRSETPLIDLRQSRLGGNIDTRQVQELPLNGRNWMSLVTMAPGARVNSAGASTVAPGSTDSPLGNQPGGFQINLDGQQVTTNWSVVGMGSPHFSRDAIAEFELVSRFDATQGRSSGVQVNAVSKSGTNIYAGTLSGYFRDDRLNAPDPVLHRVVPFSEQQISGTFGGPIRRDKLHFFGNYEYQRQPNTIISNVAYPVFNLPPFGAGDVKVITRQNYFGGRVDWVLTPKTRLMARGSGFNFNVPVQGLGVSTLHPAARGYNTEGSGQAFVSLTHATGSFVNEIKGGYTFFHDELGKLVPGTLPTILLQGGFNIGRTQESLFGGEKTLSVREDFTLFRGRHALKMGGDFFHPSRRLLYRTNADGTLDATLGPVPANIGELFPVWNDTSTWNLAPLSSITRFWQQSIGTFEIHCLDSPKTCRRRKPDVGAWFQDNWTVTSALTLNMGIRWDFSQDGQGQDFVWEFTPVYPQLPRIHDRQPQEWFNFGPRLGAAYALNTNTVLRGGWGLYYGGVTDRNAHASFINTAYTYVTVLNDGRPNFAADPFNLAGGGKVPAYDPALVQGGGQLTGTSGLIYNAKTPYSYQTSAGLQRQLSQTLAVQADYVWVAGRREPAVANINLSFDPATGVNFPFTDVSHRPYPQFLALNEWLDNSYSNYHALETAITKRFSDRWQAAATYTLSGTWNYYPEPINPGCVGPINGLTMTCDKYFKVQPDLGGEYGLRGAGGVYTVSEPDQRHRLVVNGLYELPGGFQLSGLYFYSSGVRQANTYGQDLRGVVPPFGVAEYGFGRLRSDGTVSPRNSVLNDPIHRVDLRVQWRLKAGRTNIMPLVEVFNLFDNTNFTRSWVELNPFYGKPIGQTIGSGYRVVQLGFRTTF